MHSSGQYQQLVRQQLLSVRSNSAKQLITGALMNNQPQK
jgi:hypothetical protein